MRRPVYVVAALIAIAAACGGVAETGDVPMADDGGLDASLDQTVADRRAPDATSSDAGADAARDAPSDGATDALTDAGADADADAGEEEDPILVKFAVVGDYGNGSGREALVASLIMTWAPEFIVTTGDNDYGTTEHHYDEYVGQYYHSFIAPYAGAYGAGAVDNAFFPAIGNHDWNIDDGAAYFDFFELPGNERYFELDRGPVHFTFLDSDAREPDGTSAMSTQGQWAEASLVNSAAPFKLVVFHHPRYTSGGITAWMDWPFATWGANAVLTGHVHNYERLRVDGLHYFVNGQGGVSTSGFGTTLPQSQVRYNAKDGAQLVEVGMKHARFRYYNVDGTLLDDLTIDPAGEPIP